MLRRVNYKSCPDWNCELTRPKSRLNGVPPSENKEKLELRHQRTGDVVFDWTNEAKPYSTPEYYTYKLIETLLPKAMNKLPQDNKEQLTQSQFEKVRKFKMVELWAQDETPRKGWFKVVSKK
jgi:hypothetical protein